MLKWKYAPNRALELSNETEGIIFPLMDKLEKNAKLIEPLVNSMEIDLAPFASKKSINTQAEVISDEETHQKDTEN